MDGVAEHEPSHPLFPFSCPDVVQSEHQQEIEMPQPGSVSSSNDGATALSSPGWTGISAVQSFFTWTAKIRPLSSMTAHRTARKNLTQVQRDRGMTMTSNGQLVKLSEGDSAWSGRRAGGWYHRAAVMWSKWTSVEDRFTGHVFESVVGEAVHPSAPMYRSWNTLLMFLIFYPVMVAPLVVAFSMTGPGTDTASRVVEGFLLLDIVVTFFVAVDVGKTSDHLEQRPLHVAEHYIKRWLLFDLCTSLPWRNLLPLFIKNTRISWITETATVRDALEFILILRSLTIIRRNFYSIISFQSMQYKQRAVLLASHWMSCGWMLMGKTYLEWFALSDEDAFEKTWLSSAGVDLERDSFQSQYIQALYFSITIMATIGYGDITPQNGFERTLCIMAMILGTWAYAYCITQLVDMIASWQSADVRFKAHQDDLIEYMRARNLPRGVQKRILKFYDFQRRHAAVFYREDEILSQLTPNLRAEVTHFAHYDTVRLLKRMRLFEDLEDTLLTRLIVALTTQFMPPDELVCAEGELGEVVYLIRKGVVSVIREGVQCSLLTDGQSFGETVLFHTATTRTATVITRSYCQLMLLSKAAVQAALQWRPQQYETLQEKAKVLYRAHLSREASFKNVGAPKQNALDDPAFAMLKTSMSLSQDIHIEQCITSESAETGNVSTDGHAGEEKLDASASIIAPARPVHDRPKTFD